VSTVVIALQLSKVALLDLRLLMAFIPLVSISIIEYALYIFSFLETDMEELLCTEIRQSNVELIHNTRANVIEAGRLYIILLSRIMLGDAAYVLDDIVIVVVGVCPRNLSAAKAGL